MKTFFKMFFAVVAAQIVLAGLFVTTMGIVGVGMRAGSRAEVKKGSTLIVDIYGEVMAYDPPSSFPVSIFEGNPETLHRILSNLEKAAVDERIERVVFKLSTQNNLGIAKIQEIRGAIAGVREAGKPVYAYADGLNLSTEMLAAACDSIYLAPPADVYFVGMARVMPYVKGTLDKLGIDSYVHKIKDYKSAAEVVMRKSMSPEAREMADWIFDEIWRIGAETLEKDRGLSEEKIRELMEYALFTADEAKDAGLVDEVAYWPALVERWKGDREEWPTVSQSKYAKVSRRSVGLKGDKKIAVVHAQGMIGGRKNDINPTFGVMMGHESMCEAINKARDDDDVSAIVFRVDSPGGESLTSDLIANAIEQAAAKKPVIVSMVDVAASGGYMISYRATEMIADAGTITGSIGSISGKFDDSGMFKKIGMTFDSVTRGPNALMLSDKSGMTAKQWERFKDHHWRGFNAWLRDVAKRRGMTFEEAEKLAHGRVWTGRQAKENGLIDDLGGLDRAIAIAKERAGIDGEESVTLVHYPRKKSMFESIVEEGDFFSSTMRWAAYRFIHRDLAESLRMMTYADEARRLEALARP